MLYISPYFDNLIDRIKGLTDAMMKQLNLDGI